MQLFIFCKQLKANKFGVYVLLASGMQCKNINRSLIVDYIGLPRILHIVYSLELGKEPKELLRFSINEYYQVRSNIAFNA